jgi:hypothetical protein
MKRLFLIFSIALIGAVNGFAQTSAISQTPLVIKFSAQEYVNSYVTPKIEVWQEKGRYESAAAYQERVTLEKRNALIEQYTTEALAQLKQKLSQNADWGHLQISDYDPDHQTFLIRSSQFGDFLLPVSRNEAEQFERNFASFRKTNPDFYFTSEGEIKLNQLTFADATGKQYAYNSNDPARFDKVRVDVNFDDIMVDISTPDAKLPDIGSGSVVSVGKSDIDVDIPVNPSSNDKTFAVIISNENYQRESQVIFAKNDGAVFKEYCIKTLGLPEKNVHFVDNATLNNIRAEINWISGVAQAYKGEANVIFYYAGHGIPDESTKTAYLLPIDGYGSDVATGYKLDDLYQKFGAIPAKTVTIFMDACFSGAQRSGGMLASTRGVAIKTTPGKLSGNMVVFSATQNDETA